MLAGVDASRAVRPEPTGTETYARRVLEELLALGAPPAYRLYFNQPPPPGAFEGAFRGPFAAERRVMPLRRLWTHLRLSLELARRAPDVLFVPAHVLPFYHPCPSVVTIMDLGYLHYPQAHTSAERLYLHWTNVLHARTATRILAISEHTKQELAARYGIALDRITVTPLAADPVPPASETRDYVLAIGTVHPRKNLDLLIRAFRPLAREEPEAQLLIAGKLGWLHQGITQEVERQGLGDRVMFLGYVEPAQLRGLIASARIFAFPSLYEGFGLPVLEAQSAGVAVLASRASAIPEVAGEAALLVDPQGEEAWSDALRRLWRDEGLRRELAARGPTNAARFSWTETARLTRQALIEAAGG